MVESIHYFDEPPVITADDTVAQLCSSSNRSAFPCRRSFVRLYDHDGGIDQPGPLAKMIRARDRTGLVLYSLLLTKVSGGDAPTVALPSQTWARALGMDLPDTATARSTVSKALGRLSGDNYRLIEKGRRGRWAEITLLNESGDGTPYSRPKGKSAADTFFNIPHALWLDRPSGHHEPWYRVLTLPGLAVLFMLHWYKDPWELPQVEGSQRFGTSADTIGRGLKELKELGAISGHVSYREELKSPTGWAKVIRYERLAPFDQLTRATPRSSPKAKRKGKTVKRSPKLSEEV